MLDRARCMAGTRRRRARATGVGGIFLRSKSPVKLGAWYRKHLGIEVDPKWNYATWDWQSPSRGHRTGTTVWAALGPADKEWGPAKPTAQVNYRVDDLDHLLAQLRRAGVKVDDKVEDSEIGRFGWATDPDGNRLELWEPPRATRSKERHTPME